MAPKGPKAPPLPSGVLTALRENETTEASDIPTNLLKRLYRLEDASKRFLLRFPENDTEQVRRISPIHDLKACPNAWDTPERITATLHLEANSGNRKKRKIDADDTGGGGDDPILNGDCWKSECAGNPRCLNWLGQSAWEEKRAFGRFKKQWGLGDSPMVLSAKAGVPVGLENLGATCYMNSYLQVWFQNDTFRDAVFRCLTDPREPIAKQPLYHLQVIFAALQRGLAASFNPLALVQCLQLNAGEQQDSQEFGKLFMEELDRRFKRQSSEDLKRVIPTCFEGQHAYVTQCRRCKWRSEKVEQYRELSVPLKTGKSLEALLESTLEVETLTGDNQYRCERCQKLRDVDRFTQIRSLPPILHFSLMRFTYDYNLDERKKSKATIGIPLEIDMAQYLGDGDVRPSEPMWYDLKGMLLHKGDSAHNGHYVAHVHDSRYDDWFMFNDETVYQQDIVPPLAKTDTKAPSRSSERQALVPKAGSQSVTLDEFYSTSSAKKSNKPTIIIDDSDADTEQASSRPHKVSVSCQSGSKGRSDSLSGSAGRSSSPVAEVVKSREAYMLVYTRREEGERPRSSSRGPRDRSASLATTTTRIPADVEKALDEITAARAVETADHETRREACRADFERMRERKRSVYNSWHAQPGEDAYIMDADELHRWLVAEIDPAKKSGKKKASTSGTTISFSDSESDGGPMVTASRSPVNGKQLKADLAKKAREERKDDSGFKDAPMAVDEAPQTEHIQDTARSPTGKQRADFADSALPGTWPGTGDPIKPDVREDSSAMGKASAGGIASSNRSPQKVASPSRQSDSRSSASTSLSPSKQTIFSASPSGSPGRVPQRPIVEVVKTPQKQHDLSNGQTTMSNRTNDHASGKAGLSPSTSATLAPSSMTDLHPSNKLSSHTTIDNLALVCKHGNVDIKKVHNAKAISRAGKEALEALGVVIKPIFTSPLNLCAECCWEPYADERYAEDHKSDLKEFKDAGRGHGGACWISQRWLQAWQKQVPDFHEAGTLKDPDPRADEYNRDVYCEHGRLQPDESLRAMITGKQVAILQVLFDGYVPPKADDPTCRDCQILHAEVKAHNESHVAKAREIGAKRVFKRLIKGVAGDHSEYVPAGIHDETAYLVPSGWINHWRAYLKKPHQHEKPAKIDLQSFFCKHQGVVLDTGNSFDRRKVELVTETEWKALVELYGTRRNLAIQVDAHARNHLSSTPELCEGCRQEIRSDFTETEVKLVFILPSDLDDDGQPKDTEALSQVTSAARSATPEAVGLRRSGRSNKGRMGAQEDAKTVAKRRNPGSIMLERNDTYKDIRLKISEDYKLPVMLQRIWYKGREIEDASETVESIGIIEGEVLYVLEVPRDDPTDFTSDVKGKKADKSKSSRRVEGFAGTGLYGFEADTEIALARSMESTDDDGSKPESNKRARDEEDGFLGTVEGKRRRSTEEDQDDPELAAALAMSLPWKCQACTLDNDSGASICGACESPRESGKGSY